MLRAVDYVLRFAYMLLAPAALVLLRAIMPITGMIISAGLATAIALIGTDRFRQIKIVGRLLGGMTRLGDHYRQYPPKPLVYYILYPLLFPYWLFVKPARREFLLYRKLGAATIVILVATATLDYVREWRPIPFGYFVGMFIMTLIFQLLVTFALVMPIVTTVITFHQRGLKKTLIASLGISIVLAGLVAIPLHIKQPTSVSAQMRVNARTAFAPKEALETLKQALDAYAAVVATDPKATDAARDAALDALGALYRPDEARAFKFYSDPGGVMIYLKSRHGFVFLGRAKTGAYINKVEGLPPAAREHLKL